MDFVVVFLAVGFSALVLLAVAKKLNLLDSPGDAPERKRQQQAIPAIGGLAIILGGTLLWLTFGPSPFRLVVEFEDTQKWLATALVLAFGVGLVDDLKPGGLSPSRKVLGQAIASTPLAICAMEIYGPLGAWLAVPAGIVAMNLANTYDNSDGALTSLAAVSIGPVAPAVAVGLVAFLPFNVGMQSGSGEGQGHKRRDPRAYLGDSGSHLIGMLILSYPLAWGFFLLPALDLARVSLLRIQAGRHIWSGDRLHLAHRLEDRGFSTGQILIVLLSIALPAIGGPWLEHFCPLQAGLWVGVACATLIFFWTVSFSAPVPSPEGPRQDER